MARGQKDRSPSGLWLFFYQGSRKKISRNRRLSVRILIMELRGETNVDTVQKQYYTAVEKLKAVYKRYTSLTGKNHR